MKDVAGKVAVVTGAASGIGLGMVQAFCAAGMKVVLADVDAPALEEATEALRKRGSDVHSVVTDVSKLESIQALAEEAIHRFDKVHVLCNNAGIAAGQGPLWENDPDDWAWISGVNLDSVFFGIRTFVPRMISQGEEGHVVNTASLAGLVTGGDSGLYSATKFGVVAFTEALYRQLQMMHPQISASVLCPAWVNTRIAESQRLRPKDATPLPSPDARTAVVREWVEEQVREGLDPRAVGDQVLDAIRAQRFYILTHPDWAPVIKARHEAIDRGENPPMIAAPGIESLFKRLSELA